MTKRQLSDADLNKMIGADFVPDDVVTKKQVRAELKLSRLIPQPDEPAPVRARLDWHGKTEEMAWRELNELIQSGVRNAMVITGASGVLKIKFQDWITNGSIAKYIATWKPLNNGCFEIKIKKKITGDQ